MVERIEFQSIRAYRLQAHHLDSKLPFDGLVQAAGVCGFQNSPPGAWETSAFVRLKGCSLPLLRSELELQKTIVQAWSYRGVPLVFPTVQSSVFLTALIPLSVEAPWIYTLGLSGALNFFKMSFDELLPMVTDAVKYLDNHTIRSKELLDRTIADIVRGRLTAEKQLLWTAPSIYGSNQTMGEAAVSFLLRPCSHLSLVVFGERQGNSPTFTSFRNWLGEQPNVAEDSEQSPVRKFLHCFGPSTAGDLMKWLGCSTKQAKRLWSMAEEELHPVQADGKTGYMLQADMEQLRAARIDEADIILLGTHDPYLDLKDRTTILENTALHPLVWKTVANPNVILKGGRIVGIWTSNAQSGKASIKATCFEKLLPAELKRIEVLAYSYAAFRELQIKSFTI